MSVPDWAGRWAILELAPLLSGPRPLTRSIGEQHRSMIRLAGSALASIRVRTIWTRDQDDSGPLATVHRGERGAERARAARQSGTLPKTWLCPSEILWFP